MIDQELLEKAYPSRPRKIFFPWAIIFTILLLVTVFATYFLPNIPSLIEKLNFGEFTFAWSEQPVALPEFIAVYGCPLLLLLTTLLTGFLTIALATRKWWYHLLNAVLVLGLLSLAVSFSYNIFGVWLLKENAPAFLSDVSKTVYDISFYVCLGISAIVLLFCFFDNHFPLRKYKPIYKRLKLTKKLASTRKEKKLIQKQFNKLFRKKKFDELLFLLFEYEFDINRKEPLSPEAYQFLRKDILERTCIIRGKELDALYSSSSYLALRQERLNLIQKQKGTNPTAMPPIIPVDAKVEYVPEIEDAPANINDAKPQENRKLTKKEIKAAKKAEKKAIKEAEKEKRKSKKVKKEDMAVENPESIPLEVK